MALFIRSSSVCMRLSWECKSAVEVLLSEGAKTNKTGRRKFENNNQRLRSAQCQC